MRLSHERRECGCIPDPGSPPERAGQWAWGNPFHETLSHDYTVAIRPFMMDEVLVTNADYERFLNASGYKPAEPRNFLKHWVGKRCPARLRDHPVVYVDLDDARAYARWAGKRWLRLVLLNPATDIEHIAALMDSAERHASLSRAGSAPIATGG